MNLRPSNIYGGMPEWLIGAVLKTVVRSRVPWVRIPPPPFLSPLRDFFSIQIIIVFCYVSLLFFNSVEMYVYFLGHWVGRFLGHCEPVKAKAIRLLTIIKGCKRVDTKCPECSISVTLY